MNLINHSHQGNLLKTVHQTCRYISRGVHNENSVISNTVLPLDSKKALLIVFNMKPLLIFHRYRCAMQNASRSIQQYLSVWDHSSSPKNCLFILMQQQLEVAHRETPNALTTIKLAVALITNSNCEYFLDEILKPIMPGCAGLQN